MPEVDVEPLQPRVFKRLRSAGTPRGKLLLFTYSPLIPLIAYCSSVVFPGLLKQDSVILRRLVSFVSKFTFILYSTLVTCIAERNLFATPSLIDRLANDVNHPLHDPSLTFRSLRVSRSSFRRVPARTETHQKSFIPSLLRLSIDPSATKNDLLLNFARN